MQALETVLLKLLRIEKFVVLTGK